MGPYLYDCSQWYDEEQARNTALQEHLDAVNSINPRFTMRKYLY
jgi:hypothetical protein